MKKLLLINFIFLSLWSCENKVIQYPVSYNNDDFMKRSQERGKLLLEEEISWFDKYMKDSELKFNKTESGFWISNSGIKSPNMANIGDYVHFTYQVYDIDNKLIYSSDEVGEHKAILGKANYTRGINAALQLIEPGKEAKLLLPSFLAYGGFGDQDKIGANQPIIVDLKIIDIKKH
ncbi:FKBP-type peptidyl-prolyl cis-trans isomerase [Faecalibacter rhinopitheci]|uniref:Peptidyl-prolyl cis-trans isomerase n=1 Tax=Faecalibacter rhinopitheci TaxID=2779678 RepID=A0A8J7FN53_9FLAO|nr:FKBP-type peptidyl-prolyl cis-trans isomerase [Faecalibacter rhinopitheci]MBF0596084.1 FKBP-type peptidyl-prolyl cis-trans isomerase [Faecalibacter rhinopitheci]